jgi:hypothetical protein
MFEAKRTVLETLASIGYDKEFTVTFVKKDGTPRTMMHGGHLILVVLPASRCTNDL